MEVDEPEYHMPTTHTVCPKETSRDEILFELVRPWMLAQETKSPSSLGMRDHLARSNDIPLRDTESC